MEAVLRLLQGKSLDTPSRELGFEIYRLDEWQRKALHVIDSALKVRQGEAQRCNLNRNEGLKTIDHHE